MSVLITLSLRKRKKEYKLIIREIKNYRKILKYVLTKTIILGILINVAAEH